MLSFARHHLSPGAGSPARYQPTVLARLDYGWRGGLAAHGESSGRSRSFGTSVHFSDATVGRLRGSVSTAVDLVRVNSLFGEG